MTDSPEERSIRRRTTPGRLFGLDQALGLIAADLLRLPGPAPVVDVGFGHHPWTTLEMGDHLRAINPESVVIGVETDEDAVERAQPDGDERTQFLHAGFELNDALPEPPRLVRAPVPGRRVLRAVGAHLTAARRRDASRILHRLR